MALRPAIHGRTISSDSTSSTRFAAQRAILEHILSYPGTYELPLRTMYTLNSAPRAQPIGHNFRSNSTACLSPASTTSPPPSARPEQAAQQLTSSLMAELSQMSSQPTSLPPSFVTSFVRKCFTPDLRTVDFPQALTGLDYLKDLEMRRRKEVQAAVERLNLHPHAVESIEEMLIERYPGAVDWYRSLEYKERKIEALYTALYIGLRRWILVNEMSLAPFNKHSCIAMLNTVYPPVSSSSPTPRLTHDVLNNQRKGFFKYIQHVEVKGPGILGPLIVQGKRLEEEHGWTAVRDTFDKYLTMANQMIDECANILDIEDPACANTTQSRRKVDSGVTFATSRKSSTSSTGSNKTHELPAPQQPVSRPALKGSTTLEKIVREFRHMTRSKPDISEIIRPESATPSVADTPHKTGGLRKMKSLGNITLRRSASREGSLRPVTPSFDVEEMRRQRLAYETKSSSPMAMAH